MSLQTLGKNFFLVVQLLPKSPLQIRLKLQDTLVDVSPCEWLGISEQDMVGFFEVGLQSEFKGHYNAIHLTPEVNIVWDPLPFLTLDDCVTLLKFLELVTGEYQVERLVSIAEQFPLVALIDDSETEGPPRLDLRLVWHPRY